MNISPAFRDALKLYQIFLRRGWHPVFNQGFFIGNSKGDQKLGCEKCAFKRMCGIMSIVHLINMICLKLSDIDILLDPFCIKLS